MNIFVLNQANNKQIKQGHNMPHPVLQSFTYPGVYIILMSDYYEELYKNKCNHQSHFMIYKSWQVNLL